MQDRAIEVHKNSIYILIYIFLKVIQKLKGSHDKRFYVLTNLY